ncbi:MAG: aminotransferase class V-fold PLP-dependent enzyme [Clostridiales bacterium]|nr:aminotransferase class V-fold PLP-dependent enzyme [Clostridiales bacterium]
MVDWDKVRKEFPISENSVYFQSAAMSPLPTPVFEAIVHEYRKLCLYGDVNWTDDMARFGKLCASLAELINTEADNVTFVQNTSTVMSLLALSFKNQVKKPFNIVSMKDEFPASTVGFEYQNIDMRYVGPVDARYPVESILDMTDGETLAVVTSQVQYATGFRQDVRALGQELKGRGILFIVNATQAFPYFPVDVKASSIDVLTASLHKWGLAGHIGTMFFTTTEFREKFPSPIAGWLSVDTEGGSFIHTDKNAPFRLLISARRYEFGTFNLQPLLAFEKALDFIKAIGIENIQERLFDLTDYLIQGLQNLKITVISPVARREERSAIVCFTLGERNRAFVKKCAEKKIFLTLRDGNIRVSVNIFNNFFDIDLLIDVLRTFG